MKEFRNPQDVHKPVGAYTHQIEVRGRERLLVVSGQVGMRPDGTVPEDLIEQIDIAFENILRNLRAANMDVRDIIKINYYLVGESDIAKRREVVLAKLQDHQPCSTLVFVALPWQTQCFGWKLKLGHPMQMIKQSRFST